MKKILIGLLLFVVLVIGALYIFIPTTINISSIASSPVNKEAAHRILMKDENWKKWWPGEEKLLYNGHTFSITKKMINAFEFSITRNGDTISGVLELIPIKFDTTGFNWSSSLLTNKNPIKRFKKYQEAVSLKKNLDFLLKSLSSYLGKIENIYGFEIKKTFVTDSILMATRKNFDHYPTEAEVDLMINKLRNYIKINNTKEMNYPMLNVHQLDSNHFDAMIAIATDKALPETKEFSPKALLKGGNLLEADIMGGHYTINKSFAEFENYMRDYNRTAPAIPYQLLITDRFKNPDTLKWETKICYPVY